MSDNSISSLKKKDGNFFMKIETQDSKFFSVNAYRFDEDIYLHLEIVIQDYSRDLELALRLIDKYKRPVFTIHEKLDQFIGRITPDMTIKCRIKVPGKFITPGKYSWTICINLPGIRLYDLHEDALEFFVAETGSTFAGYEGIDYGCVFANYQIEKIGL
jgi:lipopolysaccharide transport system ATP-binding protein